MKTIPLILLSALASVGFSAEVSPPIDRPERPMQPPNPPAGPGALPSRERMPKPPAQPNALRGESSRLGLGVAPAGPALVAQLGLAPDTGLVVTTVAPKSPAEEKVRPHDVLVEVDGQLLIHPEQFAVLIRNRRPGDEITLKLIRRGQAETVKAKLSDHEIPVFQPGPIGHAAMPGGPQVKFPGGIPMPGQPSLVERQIELNRRNPRGEETVMRQRRVVVRDEAGSIELNVGERGRTVSVKDQRGETVFEGPLNSPADFEAVPPAIRPRLERLPEARGPIGPNGRQ